MSKTIVVFGVTGAQGGAVANVFANEPGWTVRGVTRDPSKPSAARLREAGIELVAGDLDDPASLAAAVQGAAAVFGCTDFWQFAADPRVHELARSKGVSVNEACFEREVRQGKNLVDAVAGIAGEGASLQRFVLSTLSDAKKWSRGRITWNWHFDSKAAFEAYLRETYPELVKKSSFLQIGSYMTNGRKNAVFTPQRQEDGNFLMRVPPVASGKPKPIPYIYTERDTGHYVRALVLTAPPGTAMLAYSTKTTVEEFAETWTRVLHERGLLPGDKHCRVDRSLTLEEVEKMMRTSFARELFESMLYSNEFGWDGGDPEVQDPAEVGVQIEKLTSLEQFIREEDWSHVSKL